MVDLEILTWLNQTSIYSLLPLQRIVNNLAVFSPKDVTGLDTGLDGKIYTALNIDFSQSNS